MRRLKYLFFVQLLIFPMIFSQITAVAPSNNITTSVPSISATGVAKYTIDNYVTYTVEVNQSIVQTSGTGNYKFKNPRLNDRQPNNPLTVGTNSIMGAT